MKPPSTALRPGQLAQIACLLEATARKPGNVHRFRDFDDAHYLDFLLSAAAIAGPMDRAAQTGLGASILAAVEATRRLVETNTNLGMILLLAPLAAVPTGEDLRTGVARILGSTTAEDASLVYQAIRLAQPGGLGQADDQDVADEPTITLTQAMQLAADRDLIARQYALGYADVFDLALPTLQRAIASGQPVETAIIATFLEFLGSHPDTLIARKRGLDLAREVSARAREVLRNDWAGDEAGIDRFHAFDAWLRLDGHSRNPGATADLVTAALFAALRDGTIPLPIAGPWSSPGRST